MVNFNKMYESVSVCGVVTVPDGRILAHRLCLSTGKSEWSAMIHTNCYGPHNPSVIMRRLARERFGIWPPPGNMKHIISHSKNSYACDGTALNFQVYHIKFINTVEFEVKNDVETMAIPFRRIIEDLKSGVWTSSSVKIFNVLDRMCKKEFDK